MVWRHNEQHCDTFHTLEMKPNQLNFCNESLYHHEPNLSFIIHCETHILTSSARHVADISLCFFPLKNISIHFNSPITRKFQDKIGLISKTISIEKKILEIFYKFSTKHPRQTTNKTPVDSIYHFPLNHVQKSLYIVCCMSFRLTKYQSWS